MAVTPFQLAGSLPTNYEYFTSGGIKSGLSADQPYFTLNNRNVSIYSGAMHYFRVPRAYWRDRLKKLRAAGLNAVETYIPWNLHEPRPGQYDFGDGGSDMQDFLDVAEFLKTAQEEDLFAIIRPGPFICAEFEFGGFPSWLLRENGLKVRTSESQYMKHVTSFFNVLLPILAALTFTKGGPIIAFQIENEYAGMGKSGDKNYLKSLRQLMLDNGINELLVTADNPKRGKGGTIPELFLMTGNFNADPDEQLDMLKDLQPNKPLMAMEYWGGGFDFWGSRHNTITSDLYGERYEAILKYPASVNIYMFHGGTNFGFLNGAQNRNFDDENSGFSPAISCYDCDAPLSVTGDYTDKYHLTRELLSKYNPVKTKLPDLPAALPVIAYPSLNIQSQISFETILNSVKSVGSEHLVSMDKLDINGEAGQSFGYIVYRKENIDLAANAVLQIDGRVCDTVVVLVNGVLKSPYLKKTADLNKFGTWRTANATITLTSEHLKGATLDLVVENWGRVNVHNYLQYKGLYQGQAYVNGVEISHWTIFPLEFKTSWINSLSEWESANMRTLGPAIYKTVLEIEGQPEDTFIYMENWIKGIVIVNGFVLGRYAHLGPIQTLYLPAPFLKKGSNDILVFEHFRPVSEIAFSKDHIFATF